MPFYMINPPSRRTTMARRATRRKRRTAAQKRATAKMIAANRKKRRGSTTRRKVRRRRSTSTGRTTVAKRRRSSTTRRRSRGRRRGTSTIRFRRVRGAIYKRNPPLLRQAMQGVKDAVAVVGGKAATRMVANLIPLDKTGVMGLAVQGAAALGVGMLAARFLNRDIARFVTAGGLAAPVETALASVPVIGPALSGDDMVYAALPMGEYAEPMGEYAEMGEYAYS